MFQQLIQATKLSHAALIPFCLGNHSLQVGKNSVGKAGGVIAQLLCLLLYF